MCVYVPRSVGIEEVRGQLPRVSILLPYLCSQGSKSGPEVWQQGPLHAELSLRSQCVLLLESPWQCQ